MKKSTLNFSKKDKFKFKKRLVEFTVPDEKKSNQIKRTQSLPSNIALAGAGSALEPSKLSKVGADRASMAAKASMFQRNSKAVMGSISSVKTHSTAHIVNRHRAWSSSPQNNKSIKRPLPSINNFVPVLPKKVLTQMTAVLSRASFVGELNNEFELFGLRSI